MTENTETPAVGQIVNAFFVDVEDYYQGSAFEKDIDRGTWDDREHRVVDNTTRMLDLIARHDVTATFFVIQSTHPISLGQ